MYKYLLLFLLPLQGYCARDSIWELDTNTVTARFEVGGPNGLTALTFKPGTWLDIDDLGRVTDVQLSDLIIDSKYQPYEPYPGQVHLSFRQQNMQTTAECGVPLGDIGGPSYCYLSNHIPDSGPKTYGFTAVAGPDMNWYILRVEEGVDMSGTQVTVNGRIMSTYSGREYVGRYTISGRIKYKETRGPHFYVRPNVNNLTCSPSEPCVTGMINFQADWFWGSADLTFNLPKRVEVSVDGTWTSGTARSSIGRKESKNFRFRVVNPPVGTSTYTVPIVLTVY
ncbi:hypothetical protein D3G64_11430 [Escherichia coli]|nr:hypothetical protein [Escherichia coli]